VIEKNNKTLSQNQMWGLWDTIEDVLMATEQVELPYLVDLEPGKKQPVEELKIWSDILSGYITQETRIENKRLTIEEELFGENLISPEDIRTGNW